jgi:PAS domain S-box-containing protein
MRKDGSRFWASVVITALRGPDGRLSGFGKVTRDITERRREAERRSADKIAQLASIIESSQDAIIGSTLDGIVRSWNRGAEALYGYTAEETVGRSAAMFVPPELWEDAVTAAERLKRGDQPSFRPWSTRPSATANSASLAVSATSSRGRTSQSAVTA